MDRWIKERCIQGITLTIFFIYGINCVEVNTNSYIKTTEKQPHVTLPCTYSLENSNQKCNIEWYYQDAEVIEKHTSGAVTFGQGYAEKVNWGEGCSLILSNPIKTDSGIYTVRIVALSDNTPFAQEKVNLTVTDIQLHSTFDVTQQTTTAVTDKFSIQRGDAAGVQRTVLILFFVIAIMAIFRIVTFVLLDRLWFCLKSREEWIKWWRTYPTGDKVTVFLLTTAAALDILGIVFSVITSFHSEVIAFLVFGSCVGLFIHDGSRLLNNSKRQKDSDVRTGCYAADAGRAAERQELSLV